MWAMINQMGSVMATGVFGYFVYTTFQQFFQRTLAHQIDQLFHKLVNYFNPYLKITFHEYEEDGFRQINSYKAIEHHLRTNSTNRAKRHKAKTVNNSCKTVVLSMEEYEEVVDEFKGIKIWWSFNKVVPPSQTYYWDEKRYYQLTCHRKNRDFITKEYLQHVLVDGEAIATKARQRKIYTNTKSDSSSRVYWTYIPFKHPSTFNTLAMDPKKKKDILDDLITFSKSEDYYENIGKCWKRGYLLYGPPGTGKSSMIAAMANLLQYDIFDLELTSVKDNTELKKLLIQTESKSIIVIEDIDCSLDLTGKRKEHEDKKNCDDQNKKDPVVKKKEDEDKKNDETSKVTLSGLLNFIDGLWSACGSERVIVFTTNHIEKLDSALIRRGRMDMHIEMSYCCFEAFKVLAKNYLGIESHDLFVTIGRLLGEINMTPADVAENLMPKSSAETADICLNKLITCLERRKEEAKLKAIKDANKVESGEESSDEESG
ncbi:AAA-ATPase At3g28580-like [Rutidosis leptorrhynchoides]|uniref:AAA-ATPase At3g28580-like n=1 Tax=Rutidosis leptorrhynchoides TaxID=125765 RepID=UPI003A9A1A10